MEDERIIELYWQRSDEAIVESAHKYGAYCRTVANNLLSDGRDAEECVNDTWLHAWNAIPPHRPHILRLFFGKLTRRAACDRYRELTAAKRGGGALPALLDELEDCLPLSPSAEKHAEDAELGRSVNRFLRELSERDCNIFLRRYWYGEQVREIAGRYGLNENTVKTSLRRSRAKLREHLEKEELF